MKTNTKQIKPNNQGSTSVPCPACGQGPGEQCLVSKGKPVGTVHHTRGMAYRLILAKRLEAA